MTAEGLAPLQLIAVATDVLMSCGYSQVTSHGEWDTPAARLFEDQYSVVGIAVFDTCEELLQAWPDLQGSLVDTLSKHVGPTDPKSWDGYLVLMTPSVAPSQAEALETIRYNTNRVRKLVATGDELRSAADVTLVLSSLLPLAVETASLAGTTALDLLPRLLAERGIDEGITQTLVTAFRSQEPLIDQLHRRRREK